jgi:two-component system, sensor histidine kinase PhcS
MTIENENMSKAEFREAFLANEKQVRISTGRLACALVFVLMPFGVLLDYFVYPDYVQKFLGLRLLCSLLIAGVWALHSTRIARKYYPVVGLPIVILPAFFITWMIHITDSASPYYAGLNLIILAVSAVGHWSFSETFLAIGFIIIMYLTSCLSKGLAGDSLGVIFNNFYFLILTGVIAICGNHLFSKLRFREFALHFELDRSRKALESSLVQLKENEAQLIHSEKLASLGRMSAGIIHEINNPLNFVTTALFTLRKKGISLPPEQQEDYSETLKDVEEGVGRVKTIVSDLRVFTRPDTENCDEVPLAEVIAAALRFLHIEHKDQVQFEQVLPPDLIVWANKNKLIHILANLLQNSLDALKTKTFTDEKPTIRIAGHMENGASILYVRDNGPGISAEHLNKIYDPFFTTKDVGAGMGLGLSICYRLVQEAQGKIAVNTKPGEFCEFMLAFPTRKKKLADN